MWLAIAHALELRGRISLVFKLALPFLLLVELVRFVSLVRLVFVEAARAAACLSVATAVVFAALLLSSTG